MKELGPDPETDAATGKRRDLESGSGLNSYGYERTDGKTTVPTFA